MAATRPPAPSGQALSLISALSNPDNHALHVQAIRARDDALSSSNESYNSLCLQLAYTLVGSDDPQSMLDQIDPRELDIWKQTDHHSVLRLQHDPSLWLAFGQTAGFILKNVLLRPPMHAVTAGNAHGVLYIQPPTSNHLKETLICALNCKHGELRAVASSIIATSAVCSDSIQPALSIHAWPTLIPALLHPLQNNQATSLHTIEGSLLTIRKILEDGPGELSHEQVDAIIPLLVQYLSSPHEKLVIASLHAIIASIVGLDYMPNALVLHFSNYLASLSALASATPPKPAMIRTLVCRSIVALLNLRTEYIRPHMASLCQFMLQQMNVTNAKQQQQALSDDADANVAFEACDFWWTFCHLEEEACTPDMAETVQVLLPQLVPILLTNMVYTMDKQRELMALNELEMEQQQLQQQQQQLTSMKPLFHKSRSKHGGQSNGEAIGHANASEDAGNESESDFDDDDDDREDDDDGEWTLRKCSAATLDCLATLYGADYILPCLLPALEHGLVSSDPWIQEASILALGAVADGCMLELNASMAQLYPCLLNVLAATNGSVLPQLVVITAWTVSRYASWAVEQVQTGAQGQLLGEMTKIFMDRLYDNNRRIQVACCSAFGAIAEAAEDLMVPYLEPVYRTLVTMLSKYQGRSLLMVFDCFGILANCCGPATAEHDLPAMYVPPLLRLWNALAKNDSTDRTLLPLMECLASIVLASGTNYQLYALETFELAMSIIESVTLVVTATPGDAILNEEEVDPIVCATDLLDALVEALGDNFGALVASSQRYGQQFLTMFVHLLCKHEIPSVRMSALAMVGDLARKAPVVIEPALPLILQETITGMDPTHPTVCTNANLIALLMGNGTNGARGSDIPGLVENAAACVGRLAKVNPEFVAPDLPRFLLGWCDGMAKIVDQTERRDAFQGFVKTVYANPQAIQQTASSGDLPTVLGSILYCILTWHMPPDSDGQGVALLTGDYSFRPFPPQEAELGAALVKLVQDMKISVGDETWFAVEKGLPVNVRRLLKEYYYT
ncbi:hypothetical protein MPSEU_000314300 [Mayamaea pseudoterrestris]|nr:hypothetical protein MPSEU_000314300 [Mayamaea pseudoterrestris]